MEYLGKAGPALIRLLVPFPSPVTRLHRQLQCSRATPVKRDWGGCKCQMGSPGKLEGSFLVCFFSRAAAAAAAAGATGWKRGRKDSVSRKEGTSSRIQTVVARFEEAQLFSLSCLLLQPFARNHRIAALRRSTWYLKPLRDMAGSRAMPDDITDGITLYLAATPSATDNANEPSSPLPLPPPPSITTTTTTMS
ncbi:hypothetical protein CKAH01_07534 [Colletotrichum kahawae]|uniref:Uncharacterized protein n=1 Tax=Colletotrichum kahawae TaxID=34407 RepID=A0AAE0D1D8_COLKA|nr:hypothetical protein CKAH01_07534 [Colletotrichum kahawae]